MKFKVDVRGVKRRLHSEAFEERSLFGVRPGISRRLVFGDVTRMVLTFSYYLYCFGVWGLILKISLVHR